MDIDQKTVVDLTTMDTAALPEFNKARSNDAELDDEPNLFEEMVDNHDS